MFRRRDRTERILQRHLDDDFVIAGAGEHAPAESALLGVAEKYGCRLPSEFLQHATGRLGGLYVEVRADLWPHPDGPQSSVSEDLQYGLHSFGLAPEIPEWMDLDLATAELITVAKRSLIPCLKVLGTDTLYAVDSSARILEWSYATRTARSIEGSFFELLEREVLALKKRRQRRLPGRQQIR